MRKVVCLLLIFLLTACFYIPEARFQLSTFSNDWKLSETGGEVYAILGDETGYNTTVSISLTNASSVLVSFRSLSLNNEFRFNNGKLYIYAKKQRYTLVPIGNPPHMQTLPFTTQKLLKTNSEGRIRYEYYKLPIPFSDLEGAIIELSGIYRNGIELPPIKFSIDHINKRSLR